MLTRNDDVGLERMIERRKGPIGQSIKFKEEYPLPGNAPIKSSVSGAGEIIK